MNKVLIAEDDPISRRMLQAFLTKSGYDVVAVADGLEALRLLGDENAPSLAVLDWMMPGMEGPEVCRRIRQIPDRPYIYMLLLTALNQKGDLLQGLESGADDYLTKPFDAQELRARLRVGQRIVDLQDSLIAARDELRFQATHDTLTGIFNRGVVLEAAHRERARQVRNGGAFAVILVDLDHFKQINDTYGHLSGDTVLKEAAQRMVHCVRSYDTVGRYGGEEFLILVPSADESGALGLAERIREALRSSPVMTIAGSVSMTASFGVAVSTERAPLEAETILLHADDALYRAKERGRDRVELATEQQFTGACLVTAEPTPKSH